MPGESSTSKQQLRAGFQNLAKLARARAAKSEKEREKRDSSAAPPGAPVGANPVGGPAGSPRNDNSDFPDWPRALAKETMESNALSQRALISTGFPVRGVTTQSPILASIQVS